MHKIKIISLVIGALILIFGSFLSYMGFFVTPVVMEKELGPYTIAYESFTGSYAESGKIFDKVFKSLKKDGIETTLGLGVYYDDPAKVPANKLRSDCGCVIAEKDLLVFGKVQNKYKTKIIPKAKRMVAEFPLKNILSYMIGPMKVYPQFLKYAQEKKYKNSTLGIEIYDQKQKKIIFMMDIDK